MSSLSTIANKQDNPAYLETQLVEKLTPKINAYINRKIWDKNAIDDMQQEAIMIIILKFREGTIRQLNALDAFAYGVCHNLLLAHIRQQQQEKARYCCQEVLCQSELVQQDDHPILQQLIQFETREKLQKALNSLAKPRDRALLSAYYLDEQTPAMLAKQFNLTEMHFYRVLYRARKRLLHKIMALE